MKAGLIKRQLKKNSVCHKLCFCFRKQDDENFESDARGSLIFGHTAVFGKTKPFSTTGLKTEAQIEVDKKSDKSFAIDP